MIRFVRMQPAGLVRLELRRVTWLPFTGRAGARGLGGALLAVLLGARGGTTASAMHLSSRRQRSLLVAGVLPLTALLAACGGGTTPTPGATTPPAARTAAPTASPTAAAFTETTKFETNVGVPAVDGWRWVFGEIRTGAEPVTEATDHSDPWLFYTLAGTHELSRANKAETLTAGMGLWLPSREAHSHRVAAQSRVIALQLKDRPPNRAHSSDLLLVSEKPLDLKAGAPATLRVREITLAPGTSLPERAATEHCAVYVLEGALTSRIAGAEQQVAAGKAIEWRPSVPHDARNAGSTLARLVLFDVRQ